MWPIVFAIMTIVGATGLTVTGVDPATAGTLVSAGVTIAGVVGALIHKGGTNAKT